MTAGPKQHFVQKEELETRSGDGRSEEDKLLWRYLTLGNDAGVCRKTCMVSLKVSSLLLAYRYVVSVERPEDTLPRTPANVIEGQR